MPDREAKSRPGQEKKGDDPMTENSKIKGDIKRRLA
jgi:hypothetical protein